jgi:hypothetical protein
MMKRLIILFHLAILCFSAKAQQISCSPENKEAVLAKIKEIGSLDNTSYGAYLVAIGKTFIGTPYVAKTLEIGPQEQLVITLEGLDCTTFVENVLAFGLLKKEAHPDFESFLRALETIRYRDGKLNGYGSRLHYFSEWISDNEEKGLLRNCTKDLGGNKVARELNFMSQHRELYPFLADDANFKAIVAAEENLNRQNIFVLPREAIEKNEKLIEPGDIIALATTIQGLDVTHTGFAVRMADNRIHLLHASTSGQVEISDVPLATYLKKIRSNTGIMVARPQMK